MESTGPVDFDLPDIRLSRSMATRPVELDHVDPTTVGLAEELSAPEDAAADVAKLVEVADSGCSKLLPNAGWRMLSVLCDGLNERD